MLNIGGYIADVHSYHHASLGTALDVIRDQSQKRSQDGTSIIVHHHLKEDDCKDREHEAYGVNSSPRAA